MNIFSSYALSQPKGAQNMSSIVVTHHVCNNFSILALHLYSETPVVYYGVPIHWVNTVYLYIFSTEPSSMKQLKFNGWLHNNGHMTSKLTDQMNAVTDSVVEHYKSVSMQHGYDNMLLDSA